MHLPLRLSVKLSHITGGLQLSVAICVSWSSKHISLGQLKAIYLNFRRPSNMSNVPLINLLSINNGYCDGLSTVVRIRGAQNLNFSVHCCDGLNIRTEFRKDRNTSGGMTRVSLFSYTHLKKRTAFMTPEKVHVLHVQVKRIQFVFFWYCATAQIGPKPPVLRLVDRTRLDTHTQLLWTRDQLVAEAGSDINTQQKLERNTHAISGTRTRDPNSRAAADLRLRPHNHRDRHSMCTTLLN